MLNYVGDAAGAGIAHSGFIGNYFDPVSESLSNPNNSRGLANRVTTRAGLPGIDFNQFGVLKSCVCICRAIIRLSFSFDSPGAPLDIFIFKIFYICVRRFLHI